MKTILRCVREQLEFRRLWLPLFGLSAFVPLVGLALPLLEKRLVDDVLLKGQLDLLPVTMLTYGGLWFLSMAAGIVRSLLQTYLAERMTQRLRQRLLSHFTALSLAFWHRENSGRTMSLFQSDASRVTDLFNSVFVGGLGSMIGLGLGAFIMLSLSWQLTVAAGLALPLVAGLAAMTTRPLRPAARLVQDKIAEVTERLQENLSGLREVVAFGREETQGHLFASAQQELVRLRMRLTFLDVAFQAGQSVLSLAASLLILGFGGYLFLRGDTTLGTVIALRSLFGQLIVMATGLFGLVKQAQTSLASADRIYGFLDELPQVPDRPDAQMPENIVGNVTFEHVGFAYHAGQPVLRDVSFAAHPGEMVALVGPSGAGKTTLVSLIARFYDPDEGQVLLDGVDMRNLKLAGLRREIGFVFQDTFLFDTTIRDNIAFGREGATEDQIIDAARAANAWEFIERFPQGLDTHVGQRGVQVSEGQRQRLAIARALLRNPCILILDEPTSALDARSERLLQTALENLMRGRTTFVIAHRLASVIRADQILVIDDGRLVDHGTHASLYQRRGLYRDLCDLQLAGIAGTLDDYPEIVAPALALRA